MGGGNLRLCAPLRYLYQRLIEKLGTVVCLYYKFFCTINVFVCTINRILTDILSDIDYLFTFDIIVLIRLTLPNAYSN